VLSTERSAWQREGLCGGDVYYTTTKSCIIAAFGHSGIYHDIGIGREEAFNLAFYLV
jgi:hypothetical protein